MSLSVAITHRFASFALEARFEAGQGLTALYGPSGSGKTTLINAIAGLIRPQSGRIELGKGVLSDSASGAWTAPRARRIGYVFQDHRLFPHLDVAQNLDYARRVHGWGEDTETRQTVIDLLGLRPLLDRRPRDLSGGESARTAIGRALLSRPQLLIMDEPLAALDAARKTEVIPYLERLRDEMGLPIVYVSHALDEVIRLATTIVVLKDGKVAQQGRTEDLLSDPLTRHSLGPDALGALLPARLAAHSDDGLSELTVPGGRIFVPQITAPLGRALRLRIRASDIILSRTAPTGLSALNILPVIVDRIETGEGSEKLVTLRLGAAQVLAQITQRSATALDLVRGSACYMILKSVSVTAGDVGAG